MSKQPYSVDVSREHGNSGDVILAIVSADGAENRRVSVPGDCTPYHALANVKDAIRQVLNEGYVEPAPDPEATVETLPPPPAVPAATKPKRTRKKAAAQ